MPFWNRFRGGGAGRASQTYRSDSVMLPRWTNPPERNTQEWIDAFHTNPRLSVVERIASDLSFAEGKLYRWMRTETNRSLPITRSWTFGRTQTRCMR